MSTIGIDLDVDQLVLTRGRDFKWTFENLDDSSPPQPVDFPPGDLFFEISTRGEHNGKGRIDQQGANGGTYIIGIEADPVAGFSAGTADPIPFDASQSVVKQAIESLPGIGVGNVSVTGRYTPQWLFTVDWNDGMSLSAGVVEAFNVAVTTAFNAMSFVTGNFSVSLSGYYESSAFTFALTHNGSLLEQEIINFVAGTIGQIITAINNALTAVEHFTGEIADISAIYAPVRHFDYEFVNGKAQTPVSKLTITPSLSGRNPTMVAAQDAKGRAPFTLWHFVIEDDKASIKVESEDCDAIPDRTKWQLVFMPEGEPAGGDPIAMGAVRVQGVR